MLTERPTSRNLSHSRAVAAAYCKERSSGRGARGERIGGEKAVWGRMGVVLALLARMPAGALCRSRTTIALPFSTRNPSDVRPPNARTSLTVIVNRALARSAPGIWPSQSSSVHFNRLVDAPSIRKTCNVVRVGHDRAARIGPELPGVGACRL